MKLSYFLILIGIMGPSNSFAGGSIGGGFPSKLEEIALSETMLSATDMAEILGDKLHADPEILRSVDRTRMMESINEEPAGILIEVQSTDFNLVATDASNGKDFIYRDATVRAMSIDVESKIVTMSIVENPALTIVVKDAVNE